MMIVMKVSLHLQPVRHTVHRYKYWHIHYTGKVRLVGA